MRLIYLSNSTIPSTAANSIQVMKMCGAFAAAGCQVWLSVPRRKDRPPIDADPFEFYGVPRTFRMIRLPWLPTWGKKRVFSTAAALAARYVRAELGFGRCVHSCLCAARLGVPVAVELHALPQEHSRTTRRALRALVKHRRLWRFVTISYALKRDLAQQYQVPADHILVAHDGADAPGEPQTNDRPPFPRLQVGYVGQLYPGKGMEVVVPLAARCPWADFHVVGGSPREIRKWQQHSLAPSANLTFHGFLPHPQTHQLRQQCDVLLAPYQQKVEALGMEDISRWMSPLKLFEYMSAGRAIISSDLPVLREVLRHEDNALLCAADSVDQWTAALVRLRDQPELRSKLGLNARADLAGRYTWKARASNILNEFARTRAESSARAD